MSLRSISQKIDTLLVPDKILLYEGDQFVVKSDQVVGITNGCISFVGTGSADIKAKQTLVFKNHLLSPGLVNTHTHLPMSLFRGLADNLPLMTWLQDYIFPLEQGLVDTDFISVGTQLSAIELIKSGVTSCYDMYFYNDVIAQVLDEAGLRSRVGVGIPSVESDKSDWQSKILNLKKKYQDHPRIHVAIAPHSPYAVSSKTLLEIGEFAKSENIHLTIHVSESTWEQQEIQKRYNKTPVQYLHSLNITGKNSLFVHCVCVDDEDLKLLSQTQTSLSYNPESNMKLANGIAPIVEALNKNVVVGLGTDGSASNNNLNLFQEMDMAIKLQSLKYKETALTAQDVFQMATLGGAAALGLKQDIGSIQKGKRADLIAIDLEHAHLYPAHNLISHLVYSAQGHEVSFVMCEGKVLMHNYELQTLDERAIYKRSATFENKIKDFLKSK